MFTRDDNLQVCSSFCAWVEEKQVFPPNLKYQYFAGGPKPVQHIDGKVLLPYCSGNREYELTLNKNTLSVCVYTETRGWSFHEQDERHRFKYVITIENATIVDAFHQSSDSGNSGESYTKWSSPEPLKDDKKDEIISNIADNMRQFQKRYAKEKQEQTSVISQGISTLKLSEILAGYVSASIIPNKVSTQIKELRSLLNSGKPEVTRKEIEDKLRSSSSRLTLFQVGFKPDLKPVKNNTDKTILTIRAEFAKNYLPNK